MIYGGPGFLSVISFGYSPNPHPSPVSKLSLFLRIPVSLVRLTDGRRTRGGGEGSQIIRSRESMVLYKFFNILGCTYLKAPL
jgi:hypothetical protein